ncbi:DUF6498-containing protein [Halomicrobium katesii]|uniref:DUF6498-containing protein n=1 Tax=Halomicrobium katesii TaxID=437163 RepID=UPI0003651293|nr:DUF6498-containing protein [Halomicrobium katesii]
MVADNPTHRRSTVALALLVNAVPLVGVFAFDWALFPVLVLYWIEAVAYVTRSSVEALFATRPVDDDFYGIQVPLERLREKRGSVTLVDWLPPIYPRNLPFALNAGWVLFGLGVVAILVWGYARSSGSLAGLVLPGVAVGAVIVVVRHAGTLSEFVRAKRYEHHSALSTFSRRRWMAVVIAGFLLPIAGAGADSAGVGLTATLAVVVAAKLVADVLDVMSTTDDGAQPEVEADDPITVPDGEPITVVGTDDRGVVLHALGLGVLLALLPPYGFLVALVSVGVGLWFGLVAAVSTVVALVAGRAVLEIPVARLAYGAVEYRVYGDVVVAYDRRLDAPQWSVARHEIADVRAGSGIASTFFSNDFGTVRLVRDDDTKVLSVVDDPEALARVVTR